MNDKPKELLLAAPRGFCAGVERAVEVVEKALEACGAPLYVKHEIVHNKHVVADLSERGVRFVEDLDDVPEGQTVIFSAHGVSPAVVKHAEQRNLDIIDATCPLVTKVHLEARRYAREGYVIFLIGHRNHVESIGTAGEAPTQIHIVETTADIDEVEVPTSAKLAYLTQTTLSVQEAKGMIAYLKDKFPSIEGPAKSDICYATTNRQEAVAAVAPRVEVMIVVGSQNSSNSNRLRELAESLGAQAYLVDSKEDVKESWVAETISIGLTSGASAPDHLIQDVVKLLQDRFGFPEPSQVTLKDEDVQFKLPKKLATLT